MKNRGQKGFTLLMSMLIVGFVALTVAVTLLIGSVDYGKTSSHYYDTLRAQALAQSCAEIALQKLRDNQNYAGNETLSFGAQGSCDVLLVQGVGETNRIIQTRGSMDGKVSKIEVVVADLSPSVLVSSWQEVADF